MTTQCMAVFISEEKKGPRKGRLSSLIEYQHSYKMDAASFLGTLAFAFAYYKVR